MAYKAVIIETRTYNHEIVFDVPDGENEYDVIEKAIGDYHFTDRYLIDPYYDDTSFEVEDVFEHEPNVKAEGEPISAETMAQFVGKE